MDTEGQRGVGGVTHLQPGPYLRQGCLVSRQVTRSDRISSRTRRCPLVEALGPSFWVNWPAVQGLSLGGRADGKGFKRQRLAQASGSGQISAFEAFCREAAGASRAGGGVPDARYWLCSGAQAARQLGPLAASITAVCSGHSGLFVLR